MPVVVTSPKPDQSSGEFFVLSDFHDDNDRQLFDEEDQDPDATTVNSNSSAKENCYNDSFEENVFEEDVLEKDNKEKGSNTSD